MIVDRRPRFSLFMMLLAAGPLLRAAPLAWCADAEKGTQAALPASRPFLLTILGPDGKGLPGVSVEFRVERPLTANQIREGRFLRAEASGVFVQANDKGRVVLELPKDVNQLDALIEPAGYAPYRAHWGSTYRPDSIPASFTAVLDAAWSADGLVVDEAGEPVPGARISPRITYKLRLGDWPPGLVRSVATDQAGRWRFGCVPASRPDAVVVVDHPDFRPVERLLTRSDSGPARK